MATEPHSRFPGGRFLPPLLALAVSACAPVEADRLLALRLASPPASEHWEHGVPLALRAGGGHRHEVRDVTVRLDPDTDPIHPSSASCHHGPPVTDPVLLEMRAFYDAKKIHLEVRWEDPTPDRRDRRWVRGDGGWRLDGEAESDGLAIIWSRDPRPFGCQQACHTDDWAVQGGSLVDVRSMYLEGREAWEEAWIWKASGGSGALVIGPDGFATAAGRPYRLPNSRAALDESLPAETRRARTFGPADGPAFGIAGSALAADDREAPAWIWGAGAAEGGLAAEALRTRSGWRVLFSRDLDMEGRRQAFRPGEDLSFGVAIFDGTATNHHIVRHTQVLRLLEERIGEGEEGENEAPSPLDGEAAGQVWRGGDDHGIKAGDTKGRRS